MRRLLTALLCCLCLASLQHAVAGRVLQADSSDRSSSTDRSPIIGILSQPLPPPLNNMSYFAASYPKYAAMGGARTVPILCDTPVEELKALYQKINGVIVPGAHDSYLAKSLLVPLTATACNNLSMAIARAFMCRTVQGARGGMCARAGTLVYAQTNCFALRQQSSSFACIRILQATAMQACKLAAGGAQDLRPGNAYYDTMSHIMDWAMADYDSTGEVFPMHFTCLGWEAVAVKVARNPYILSAPSSHNVRILNALSQPSRPAAYVAR